MGGSTGKECLRLSPSEQLLYTTTRIVAELEGGEVCTGTGFFFDFLRLGDLSVPAIVTNKHVVRGSKKTNFVLNTRTPDGTMAPERISVEAPGEHGWIFHPDENIDLCIFPVASYLAKAREGGFEPFFKAFDSSMIPVEHNAENISCIATVTMIGYPKGLWDEVNNLPIVRQGITATPYKFDYQGRKEFMIDAACFPGSSGSPIVIFDEGVVVEGGNINLGAFRTAFLGVLSSGPQMTAQGDIVFDAGPHVEVRTMMNLGYAIKAERLLDFEPILRVLAKDHQGGERENTQNAKDE